MEIAYDISSNFPSSLCTSKSNSSMFFCQSNAEEQQQQQTDLNSAIQEHQMSTITNTKRAKKPVSFPFGKCRICHDTATGVHYGVITCEGCKGFFKRSITQGVPYRCFFGDKCVINMETRNRCKACRFQRCLEQGMAMESVKMGRIPKKVKEKALRNYQKYQERKTHHHQQQQPQQQHAEFIENEDFIDSEIDNSSLSSFIRESTSSSSSENSMMNAQPSTESNQDIVITPPRLRNSSEPSTRTADLIELTVSAATAPVTDLSSLRLPPVFYESSSVSLDALGERSSTKSNQENLEHDKVNDTMTVSRLISSINENSLISYMFDWELRYSKNVLPIMKYLAGKLRQPFFIYELDFEVTSFFRYIRWKMLNFYMKHTKRIRVLIERMFGIINLGITNYPGINATAEQMWAGIQASISSDVTALIEFAKDTPGLNELNINDFTRIMNHRVFDFWTIIHYPLFYQNESYIMTRNGLHYSRKFMNQFIGKKTTDALHIFSQSLHDLKITQVEHSLIIPIILCLPDEKLIDTESVHTVKYCYMYALYIQLCMTRTEDQAKTVFDQILQVVNSMNDLNQLCNKNIGELRLDRLSNSE